MMFQYLCQALQHKMRTMDRLVVERLKNARRITTGQDNDRLANVVAHHPNRAFHRSDNCIPHLIRCAHAYCTEGEIVGTLKGVFGEYHEPAFTL